MAPTSTSTSTATKSKKRKISTSETSTIDSRFNFSTEDLDDTIPLSLPSDQEVDEEEEDTEELGDALAGPSTSTSTTIITNSNPLPAHLLPLKGKVHGIPGLIYLSRIPPGMGPSKVKHLLSAYGEVGRVFLARAG